MQYEFGSGETAFQHSMYVSRMTRAENILIRAFSKSKISKVVLETTFLHSSCHPDHYEPKIFFLVFRNSYVFNPNFEVPTSPSIYDLGVEVPPL